MPWCEDCAKYYAPSAMGAGGECPTCGRVLDAPKSATGKRVTAKNLDLKKLAAGERPGDDEGADDEDVPTPWHFKLLMVLLALYFVYRIYDLIR